MTKTILVFDTECTSLLPKNKNVTTFNVKEFPYIVQISWVIFDLELKKVIKTKDFIVKCPVHIMNSNIHGITDDISQEKGVDICYALGEFVEDMMNVDLLVAHNYSFDTKIIEAEFCRLNKTKEIQWMMKKNYYCTMMGTIDFCELESKFYGTYKWPKLCELYELMFGYQFENQHNSLADVNATLRCYLKFVHDIN